MPNNQSIRQEAYKKYGNMFAASKSKQRSAAESGERKDHIPEKNVKATSFNISVYNDLRLKSILS